MDGGELVTRGTAQLAVVLYLSRVILEAGGWWTRRGKSWKRGLWTLGCLALWLHIAAAFEFVHDWSLADAVRQTADQTEALTGWSWGGGVYINFAFAVFWSMDCISWWRRGLDEKPKSRTAFWAVQAIFAFLMFNATVVFGPAYWRSLGFVFLALLLAAAWIRRNRFHRRKSPRS